jgi:hypothetical protein
MPKRLQDLSKRCVETYISDDVIRHLEEECTELLLSLFRLRRDKGSFREFVEELVDVSIECNTVITLIDAPVSVEAMLKKKLDKFEAMLDKDKLEPGEAKKKRYREIEL